LINLLQDQSESKSYIVTIPKLVGAVYDTSLTSQFDPDIYKVEVTFEYNVNYSENTIISQKPMAGDQRKVIPGSQLCEIALVISKGAETVTMPDFTVTQYLDAKLKLEKLGVYVDLYPMESSIFPLGYVISTDPAPGDTLSIGTRVKVYYSSGQNIVNIQVPDFENMTEAEAYAAMKDKNTGKMLLELGGVTYEHSDTVEEGRIIYQSRSPYSSAPQGSKIYFVVSTGKLPDPVTDWEVDDEFPPDGPIWSDDPLDPHPGTGDETSDTEEDTVIVIPPH